MAMWVNKKCSSWLGKSPGGIRRCRMGAECGNAVALMGVGHSVTHSSSPGELVNCSFDNSSCS